MKEGGRIAEIIRDSLSGDIPEMEDHVSQYKDTSREEARHQIVVGLDYGTAFSKVVVGDLSTREVVPIALGSKQESKYLLRGECSFMDDGTCRLGRHEGKVVSNMKMRLIEGHFDPDTVLNTICLLALIMRWARLWVLLSRHRELKHLWIDWALNVGLPTESFEDTALSSTYRDMVTAAWILSCQPGEVSLFKAKVAVGKVMQDKAAEGGMIPTGGVELFPEFAAQVAAYLETPMRRLGLHLLVDVGAGTVDDTVFNVWEEDDEGSLPIFERTIKPLGARFLHRHRLEMIGDADAVQVDEFGVVPRRKEFAKLHGVKVEEIEKSDASFRGDVIRAVRKDLVQTKRFRHHRAPEWDEGVPTFLTGGGARMDVYREVVDRIASGNGAIKLEPVAVPEPNNLFWPLGEDDTDYDRVMVAYGLSMDAANIADVVPSSKIEDTFDPELEADKPRYRKYYVDKDQV